VEIVVNGWEGRTPAGPQPTRALSVFDGRAGASFRAVRPRNLDPSFFTAARDAHVPGIAADFAILNERPGDVRFQIDLNLFTAIRTADEM